MLPCRWVAVVGLTEYLRACRNITSSSGRGSLYLATTTLTYLTTNLATSLTFTTTIITAINNTVCATILT